MEKAMRYRFSDRPMFVLSETRPDSARVYLSPKKKGDKYGEHAGDIEKEYKGEGWQIKSLALKDYDKTAIQRIVFDTKEDAAAFTAMTYMQVRHARNVSPVPEPIRAFIENEGKELADEGKVLGSALLNHVYKARMVRRIADEYGIGHVYLRVDSDSAKMVRRVKNWKRDGDEHLFFSEATLYGLIGKDDARSLLDMIGEVLSEIDPIEEVDPQEQEEK